MNRNKLLLLERSELLDASNLAIETLKAESKIDRHSAVWVRRKNRGPSKTLTIRDPMKYIAKEATDQYMRPTSLIS